jgi:hypothetical protein
LALPPPPTPHPLLGNNSAIQEETTVKHSYPYSLKIYL